MSTTLSAFLEVKCHIKDKNKLLSYLSPTALKIKVILDYVLGKHCDKDVCWSIAPDFDIGDECYFVLSNKLGFVIYYNPNDSVAIFCFPYSWQKFCMDSLYNNAFKECARIICNVLEGKRVVYFSDDEKSGVASNLFFPDLPNEFALSQTILDEFGLSLDDPCLNLVEKMNSDESDIAIPTEFTHPNIERVISYLKECGVKENQEIGLASIDGYFFECF